jgi:CelD/BcsL family acetyltransferase involved in cellulose biosynthesis
VPGTRLIVSNWRSLEAPELRLAWDGLARRASEPNPFFESWYLLPALRAFDPAGAVKILRFERDGVLAGLVPLHRASRYYGRPLPHWSVWLHGNAFLGAPLVEQGAEPGFWIALTTWLDRHSGTGLFLHLPQLPTNGPLCRALARTAAAQDRPLGLVYREERAMLASPLSPEAYLEASLSGKKRKELRRQFNRLGELGELRVERRRDDRDLPGWIDQFLALEHSGWKGGAGSALASHQATTRLFREAVHGAAAVGRLERLTLWLGDAPIAMLASFITPPGAFSYKTAFDERFARFSPGVLLQRENLALLDDPQVDWCDSCAAADHPMIDHIWRERRAIGRYSLGLGGPVRRGLFKALLRLERGEIVTGAEP